MVIILSLPGFGMKRGCADEDKQRITVAEQRVYMSAKCMLYLPNMPIRLILGAKLLQSHLKDLHKMYFKFFQFFKN
jgi:hypothetical protein